MENNDRTYRIAILLARKSAGMITDAEADELRAWGALCDANSALCGKWDDAAGLQEGLQEDFRIYSGFDAERAQKDLESRIALLAADRVTESGGRDDIAAAGSNHTADRTRRRFTLRAAVLAAAVAVLLICLHIGIGRTDGGGADADMISLITPGSTVLYFGDESFPLDGALVSTGRGEIRITTGKGTEHVLRYDADAPVKPPVSVVVPRGRVFDMALEDGTSVYLNAGSTLWFPAAFDGDSREVRLSGEAYFIAAADQQRPFRVVTDNQAVMVIGTQFNVSAYPENELTVTTVFEGVVKAADRGNEEILTPGMQAVSGDGRWLVQSVKTAGVAAWRNDLFNLEGKPLRAVMAELSLWYDFRVEYGSERVKQIMFRGTVPRYESFDKVLGLMEKTGEVSFEVRGNTIRVMEHDPQEQK